MMHKKRFSAYTITLVLAATLHLSYGQSCQMEGVTIWPVPVSEPIWDWHRGEITNRATTNIESINSVSYGGGLNRGPYLDVSLSNSRFIMSTNAEYPLYEEYETSDTMSLTISFSCTGGTSNNLVFIISVMDSNNNSPRFRPSDELEFTVMPPLSPGYIVTGCLNNIIVRDIDLTTVRIDYDIEENPYFELAYDSSVSTAVKEFAGVLKTKTFIRSLPEPIILTIYATDVDGTNDPPLTNTTEIRITSDLEFEMPEEPVFSQTFYLATYTEDDQVTLQNPISLQQGYDELVRFNLEGVYVNYFELTRNDNQLALMVKTPLPSEIFTERQIFLIVKAEREYTSGSSATIIIELPEDVSLDFERVHYTGSITDNNLILTQLILSQGYDRSAVSALVFGEHSSYFNAAVQGNAITVTMERLSENIISENNFIYLEIVASNGRTSARAVTTLEIVKDDNVTPVFNQAIYNGNYNPTSGLVVDQILIVQGFDDTVQLNLQGDYVDYFQIVQEGPAINLTVSALPTEIYSEGQIVLSIEASKPRTVGANAAVIITLPAARRLEFDSLTYKGTLQDNILILETITLSSGYEESVNFELFGDYASYFNVSNVLNQATVTLLAPLPNSIIEDNNLVVLTINASDINAISTTASIVLDIIKDDTNTPVFNRNIYYGSYTGSSIDIENINLIQGYDDSVTFRIDGVHAQYFGVRNTNNNVILSVQSPIPEDVIFNEKVLSFNVLAEKNLTVGGNAAVVISFPIELTDIVAMKFAQKTYIGVFTDNVLTMEDIILNVGYASGTAFRLTGDYAIFFELVRSGNSLTLASVRPVTEDVLESHNQLLLTVIADRSNAFSGRSVISIDLPKEHASYFNVSREANVINIELINELPMEVIDQNTIIILNLEAYYPNSISGNATIVIEIIKDSAPTTPVFDRAYYSGDYSSASGLLFEYTIQLVQGFDESVIFTLAGEDSQWFILDNRGPNNLSLLVSNGEIQGLEDRTHLSFSIEANKPGSLSGNAAVIISLIDIPTVRILQFTEDFYTGSIENGSLIFDTMYLEGYASDVTYSLRGDYSNYFQLFNEAGIFTLNLGDNFPINDSNDVIILTLEAIVENRCRAHATIIIDRVSTDDAVLGVVFEENYYVGSYSESDGLTFDADIKLADGYATDITFSLSGDDSQWFELVQSGDTVTVIQSSTIPPSIVASNAQLIFVITAQRPGSAVASATIIITLTDGFTGEAILGFEQINYIGTIENQQVTIDPITLIQGFSSNVTFRLHGELEPYFSVTTIGATVMIGLNSAIPETLLPSNGIIILELQAFAPQALTAYATVVFTIVTEEDQVESVVELLFANTYYMGSYTVSGSLVFEDAISLSQGYDDSVVFALEGDQSQWFELVTNENSVTLRIISPIPPAVLASNQQLVFVVSAQGTRNSTARATIIIALEDAFAGDTILGFERINYQGTIENNEVTLEPITLIQGFSADVTFALRGELESYFALSHAGGTVTIALRNAIPGDSIPPNGIIVLELEATAPQALTAYATIVFTIVTEEDQVESVVELLFASTYYMGSYTASGSLVFEDAISLSQGYDNSVVFALEGDQSQWFELVMNENSVTLRIISPIPPAVLASNQQLVFVVSAQGTRNSTARATIIIALEDAFAGDTILGFERINYQGTIENNEVTLEPITLIQGFSADVTFALRGELESYFALSHAGGTVTIALRNAIPGDSIPPNGIIVLELEATAPQALTAYATIVFTIVTEEDQVESVVELLFASTYYMGSYTASGSLVFEDAISLSQGYDDSVVFALEGDQSQWFELVTNENSVTLRIISPIPPAVLASNQQLVFVVSAQGTRNSTARATIIIALEDAFAGDTILGFERINYQGTIENNEVTLEPITLIQGFSADVTFALRGELESYFALSHAGGTVTIALRNAIPGDSIPPNGIIVLELEATAPQALTAYATIVFTIVTEEDQVESVVELLFASTYYMGSYTASGSLVFEDAISLSQGYDDSVVFALEGDQSQWFELVTNENSVTLRIISPIPPAVLASNQQLVFVVSAQGTRNSTARATIIIALEDAFAGDTILGFERINYQGTIENNEVTLEPITLIQGFSADVTFALRGELESYFALSHAGGTVSIALRNAIPGDSIPPNGIIVLELEATAPQALTAYATIVFTIVTEEDQVESVVELLFASTYYMGSYTASGSLVFEDAISLSQGYDDSVVFALEGDQSQWFELVTNENSVTLRIISPIPPAVLASNQQLVFVVSAQGTRNSTARATIIIALEDAFAGDTILGFERINYQGTIENNEVTLEPITLIQGFSADVTFALRGELESYFALSHAGGTVTIALRNAIPGDSIPPNGIIVLELEATAPQALTAYATIVFTIVTEEDQVESVVELLFASTYYMGSYTASGSLVFEDAISLSQGYDDSVVFALEGDQSQWFELVTNENSVTLRIISPIPPAVLASNQQLVFVVSAQGTRNSTARATIIIALEDAFAGDTILGFERINYQGTIENNEVTLEPITLIQGFSADVTFALRGELESYFALSHAGGTVTIALRNAIPGDSIPPNGIIVLELEATAPQALTAYATIVFTIVTEEDQVESVVELLFASTYYMGSYTASGSLVFEDAISLSQGYDDSVVFALEGDQSQWFELVTNENSVTLRIISPIPPAVLASNQQLVFVVSAQGTRNSTARATIIIALEDAFAGDTILGFERINYQGTIENNEVTLEPITLIQGFSADVTFALRGELESYFALSHAGGTVTIALRNAIPGDSIPPNGIIVLELEATAPQALTAYATIVFTIVTEEDQVESVVELLFASTYYMGSYTASGSLVFEDAISLSQGYDDSVVFALEGDQSQWFELVTNENSVTLRIISPIPPAVLASNQQLVFVVSAQGTRNSTARATIIIALEDAFAGDTILGFERINYQGTIENNEVTLEPITLIQGFSADVTFALRGELESYFALSHAGGTVTIALRNAIPGDSIPPNGIIVLELEATAPQALTAYATIVFTIVTEEDQVESVVELLFASTYYMGSYTASGSLVFEDAISLSQGYDDSVVFALEGDQSQWFELVTNENSVTLRIISPIPPAVLASNQQLVFVVSAQGTRNSTARATIIIALEDAFAGDTILGFERINYQGTIENNEVTLEPITLIQGFSADVTFALRGELESYFALSHAGGTVTIALRNAIPGDSIPPNGIIVLELEATAPQALTAYATIVFTIVTEEDQVESVVELLFASTYYMGSYTASGSLVFEDAISLSQGYDDSVVFALEGDQSQWFELVTNENSVTLRIISPIPPAVLASNQQLVFVVSAQGTRNSTARATIIIALEDAFAGDTILGFERINYQGTIENNEVTLEPITLIQGFSGDVTFALRGEIESYFALSHAGGTVSIALRNAIPGDSIPPNGIIVLELEATAPQALTAYATIVFTIVTEEDQVESVVELLFASTYYMGSYTASGSLVFEDAISLSQGYDDSVVFALEGDQSQWFELVTNENSVTLRIISPIPPAVLASNQQLVFVVSAQGTRNSTARATIIIALEDAFAGDTILGFERINYQGTIENNEVTLEPITLIQGFSADVTFALRGELESYFALSHAGGTVTIALRNAIPGDSIPPNGIIVLELEATAPQALTAYATIVFTIVTEEDQVESVVELLFASTYYMGSYTASGSLVFEDAISLSQGYDDSVVFALEGDQSQWFELVTNENSVTLRIISPIPPAVLASNQQLVFVVSAQGTRNSTARATIIIALEDAFAGDTILGFERINYQGTIENNEVTLEPITLIQGFSADVTFALRGELESYFALSHAGGTVTIALRNAIPGDSIPPNGIIVLELEATAPQALTAYATIVFTIVTEEDQVESVVELLFASTYYVGSYTASGSLVFEDAISLSQGYDDSVVFALEGDQSQWFELVTNENSVTLRIISPIPPAVLASNQQLVFVVSAQGTRNSTARATIIIALEDAFAGDTILGFERINYQGTIENNEVTLEPITLIQGFSGDVTFALRGEIESYFALSHAGGTVSIALRNAIPGDSIPPNGIIVLELEATAPQALTAYATIVFTIVTEEDQVESVVELLFASTYYMGSYTASGSLVFEDAISLSQGYDDSVVFALEGDQSQWFELVTNENSVTLRIISPIPPAVLASNQQLVFVVSAQGTRNSTARATIIIALEDAFAGDTILGFERINYQGTIENNEVTLEPITLIQGFSADVTFALRGELESYFALSHAGGTVTIALRNAIPGDSIPPNGIIVLELEATAPQALTAYATIVFTIVTEEDQVESVVELLFASTYYMGSYTASGSLVFEDAISLSQGYDDSVVFALEGDQSQWFELVTNENSVTLRIISPIPPAVLASNQQLVFVVSAQGTRNSTARATIIIALEDAFAGDTILGFERINYQGTIENNEVTLEPITLIQGFSADVTFALRGELESYFALSHAGGTVTIALRNAIPGDSIPPNGIIVLELEATAPQALTAYATIVFTIVTEEDQVESVVELLFASTYYVGSYTASGSLVFEDAISLSQGYDDSVVFALEGDQSQWFELVTNANSVTLRIISPIPPAVLASNQQLVFVVSAQGTRNSTARATIIIALEDAFAGDTILGFERINYQGTIENNEVTLEPITLIQGFSADVTFALRGELESYFALSHAGGTVTIAIRNAIPGDSIPPNGIIVLELEATAPQALAAYATVVFTVITQDSGIDPIIILEFADSYYTGSYSADGNFIFNTVMSLSRGYDEHVVFYLEGEQSQWFELSQSGNSVTLQLSTTIPPSVVANYRKLLFIVTAQREGSISARATVIISLLDDTQIGVDVYFEKILHNGVVHNDIVQHESITVRGFTGTNIEIVGGKHNILLLWSGLDAFPDEVPHVAIELHAGTAATVLILTVIHSGEVNPPLVTFSAPSYVLRADVIQTGLLGRVVATANNGEAVVYSLVLDNAHLQSRLSINNEGELYLSAPVNSGVYKFEVAATTIFTQATGTATVHLTVESLTVCGEDELVVPPLIILDRDEEEPHRNLVVLDTTRHEGCWYSLTNRWPIEQNWLYVDDTGLHASSIDREHKSIAFMALSQIQVELVLHCDTDNTLRSKRSLEQTRMGPYDYGNNKWVLTDTIQYNSRRSFVNLIVNDINDNAPIFVGKDQEPIAAGYPIPELIDTIVPRALAEVQATDADIGENAELLYWSNEPVLAVASTTGFVHVRDGVQLEDGSRLTINATDRNGAGLTGSLEILVRLLDTSNIVVMTVQGAFLDDEKNITLEISANIGYEIKVLRSAVISADVENEPDNLRMKRDTDPSGASLQLYVYGLIAREPVTVERLTTDINNIAIATVSIISTVSLEDYLEGREICVIPGRDTGLLIATIILSILLFIILVSIGVWYFLKWRKENYDKFSDENSLTSRNESFGQLPKPVSATKPWLNIEDLKKSERRLQEMLNAPIEEVTVEPSTSKNEKSYESVLDLPPPDSHVPIVIQSIDKLKDPEEDSDDDEFGEGNKARRKSVVTFNENVEKIIHVEDDEDTGSHLGYEIYKL
ncbi:hypothetical protein K1T71_004466 [Dendrolimus kikuchii]|uniref:Uncharacterized protein n=1 Tax=Dendrolimus kikuchii TaxID=765133 RepID=A0ACC1D7R4_9NEOP|nr:hypothetical protein K1T71_004466 [Dendrolimus kikuchii]